MASNALALPTNVAAPTKGKGKSKGGKTDAIRARARAISARAREHSHLLIAGGELIGTGLLASLLANSIGSKYMFKPKADGSQSKSTWIRPVAGHALSDLRLWGGILGILGGVYLPKAPNSHAIAVSSGLLASYALGLSAGWGRKMITEKEGGLKAGYAANVAGVGDDDDDDDGDEVGKFSKGRDRRIKRLQEQIRILQLQQEGATASAARQQVKGSGSGGGRGLFGGGGGGRRLLPVGQNTGASGPPAGSQKVRVWDPDTQSMDIAYLPQ